MSTDTSVFFRARPFRLESPAGQKTAGFSLVEIVLALGILSFACIGLIGMLSAGLTNFRATLDISTGAQIFQNVVTDIQQMEFDTLLETGANSPGDFFVLPQRYFGDQGNEVVPTLPDHPSTEEAQRIVYQVRVRVSRPGAANASAQSSSGFTSLPSDNAASRFQLRDTVFVTIQIVTNPGNRLLPTDARQLWAIPESLQQTCALTTYSTIITRNGHQSP